MTAAQLPQTPRLSIGLPVYNGAIFLEETLRSLLSQTFDDFELIISDNASTDATEAICRAYAAQDPRLRYMRNPTNIGAAGNYNRVFACARGAYFKWAAADDLCAPTFLARCVHILDTHPAVILAYPKTSIIDEHGQLLHQEVRSLDLRSPSVRTRFDQAIRKLGECNAVFGLIRSQILRHTSCIGNYMASDMILLAELSLYGQFYEIPEPLFLRRQHPGASSSNKSVESQQEFFDPTTQGKVFMLTWHLQRQHLRMIKRAPLKPSEKLLLLRSVAHFAAAHLPQLLQEPFGALQQMLRKAFVA